MYRWEFVSSLKVVRASHALRSFQALRLLVLYCSRAGFCSIRKNIRASLVEPRFVFCRAEIPMARSNKPCYFPELSKNLHDYMFIIPEQKTYFENKNLSTWETSFMRERAHTPVCCTWETALLQKISFGGNSVIKACVASHSPLLISLKQYNDSTLMEFLFLQLTFKRKTKLSVISSEIMTLSRFREKSRQ